jgi:hypothetical protein
MRSLIVTLKKSKKPSPGAIYRARRHAPLLNGRVLMGLAISVFAFILPLLIPSKLAAQQKVVINEIMYAPLSTEPQWIELFNPDSGNFNIAGWQIGTGTGSATLPIDEATADQKDSFLVITSDSNALRANRPGSYPIIQCALPMLNATGDQIVLSNASSVTIDSLMFFPSWGGMDGNSLERRNALASSNDSSNWGTCVAPSGATPGARNSIATPDSTPTVMTIQPLAVVMNEIMFAPIDPEPEWIELLNTTSDTINIAGWILTVQDHTPVTVPAGSSAIPNTLVPPDSLIVLSSNDTELAAYRHVNIQRIVRCSLPDLKNTGSTLSFHDPTGDLIDSAWYDGSWVKADGISIERINPEVVGYDSTNWGACKDPSGSTILRPNSIGIRNYDLAMINVQPTDSSVAITIVNLGLDTVRQTAVALQIGAFSSIVRQISTTLPSQDSLVVQFPLPRNFYGLFPASAYLVDSLNEDTASDTLRFSVAPPIPADSLVINEIMFDPQPGRCQWLELYNLSTKWISLDSTQLITGESHPGEYSHVIPALLIAPDSFGLITANDSIYSDYPALVGRNSITSLNESSLDLGIDSCWVVLHNDASIVGDAASMIDSVHYFKTWQQSPVTKTFAGISLERIDPRSPSNDPSNWQASLDPSGATPLAPNSVRIRNYELTLSNANATDTSIAITVVNIGLDTIRQTAIAIQIGTFTPIVQQITIPLPSHDSLVVLLPMPENFYGSFAASAYIMDSLNENPSNDTLHFNVAPPIPADSLVTNEIMFDPLPGSCQWLELYNLSAKWISLDSAQLITGESRPGEYTHVIPSLLIAPDSFGLVTANDSIFTTYPALVGRNGIASLGESTLDMGEDSCFAVLHNKDSSSIDSVHYFKNWQQSLLKKTFAGISLERKDPHGPSNESENWQASLDTLGATPLAPNSGDTTSTSIPVPTGTVFQANFTPNPFSPDGDGFEDVSVLSIQTGNSTEWAMQVRLYDASGRIVRTLTNGAAVLGSASFTFDGKRDNGQTLPPGLYTVLIELTSQSPVETLKQETGVVIAHRRR